MLSPTGGSPLVEHHNLKPQSPRRTLRQEARQTAPSSAPNTPLRHTHRLIGYGHSSQPQLGNAEKTSSENAMLADSMRDHDDGDPHDLSFPTKHFPRASMVDNLVMSLDQFPPATNKSRTYGTRSSPGRSRGHTKSSSVTVESEVKTSVIRETPLVRINPAEEAAAITVLEKSVYTYSEEEESQREKTYNAQRAMQTGKVTQVRPNLRRNHRSDSNSSSVDLGHLTVYAGRLGGAGNRRSQSFDLGSTRPKPVLDNSDTALPQVAHLTTDNTNLGIVNSSVVRDVTPRDNGWPVKSNTTTTRGRSGTLGAANSKARLDSPQPQTSTKSNTFNVNDRTGGPNTEQNNALRAGFFRRVFGSSNRGSMGPSSYPSSARQSQERAGSALDSHRPTTPPANVQKQVPTNSVHNKESQPMITKKTSSFFRRRKKSISGGVPPPLPLTLNGNLDAKRVDTGASSPVSSLRAFMDPYLGEGTSKHARGSSLQSVQNADEAVSAKAILGAVASDKAGKELGKDSYAKSPEKNPKISAKTEPSLTADGRSTSLPQSDPSSTTHNEQPTTSSKSLSLSPGKKVSTQHKLAKSTTPTSDTATDDQSSSDHKNRSRVEDGSPLKAMQNLSAVGRDLPASLKMIKLVPQSSGSDTSDYKSAPSTPLVADIPDRVSSKPLAVHISHPSISSEPVIEGMQQARKIYYNTDHEISPSEASAWLGEASNERAQVRIAYMSLFDWTSLTILAGLRNLCSKLVLKGETQQVDRILDAFAKRWCDCNANHGFKSADIVHTICYSILLLNTDLHLADIGKRMTKPEFVRNAKDAIRENMADTNAKPSLISSHLTVTQPSRASPGLSLRPSMDRSGSSLSTARPHEQLSREQSYEDNYAHSSGSLVETPYHGSQAGWEAQIESVLKEFYFSISKEPLPLFGSQQQIKGTPQQSTTNVSTFSTLRRTPSVISKTGSETRGRYAGESRSLGARWASKNRSRPRVGTSQAFGSSRTSIDDQSSAWSPSMSSTWSKVSLGKTLTSMSVDSFSSDHIGGGYQSSIGFANALSQAIIRDEQMDNHNDEGIKATPLLEDESLELYGAPWAKEGILKHKCHLEGVGKRSKDRNWNDCFAVIEKGWMRLFSFSLTAKSLRNKARNHKAGAVVGGGNWQDNAEEIWKFMLRHTIASSLPPPGYSKQRPYVWALSLPNGAVHLFSVGTPDIVKEFVSTANFWSARLSKEPMAGGISSMEYGWSDSVINRALVASDSHATLNAGSPRPSTQLSMRSSIDHGSFRPRLPGDKAHISEWVSPQQSLMASQLLEIDQLRALQAYVKNIEDDLSRHNELRGPMLLVFSSRHPNSQKAMSNWEKKSSYLLREIVKFRTYIDALQSAQATREKVDKLKREKAQSGAVEILAVELPTTEV